MIAEEIKLEISTLGSQRKFIPAKDLLPNRLEADSPHCEHANFGREARNTSLRITAAQKGGSGGTSFARIAGESWCSERLLALPQS